MEYKFYIEIGVSGNNLQNMDLLLDDKQNRKYCPTNIRRVENQNNAMVKPSGAETGIFELPTNLQYKTHFCRQ